MKKLNTSGTLQRVNFFFFLLPLFFISSLHTQTIPNEKLIEYYDRMYPWKPPEYNKQNDDTVLTVLGRWAWGPCHAVDVKGSYAYIGNGPTFHVLDIYDPSKPVIVGEFLTEGYVYDIKVRDDTAFIGIGSGLLILDVSNPALPQQVSFISIDGIAGRISIDGSFVYVAAAIEILWVVDISDIKNPFLRGSLFTDGRPSCIAAKDGYVYIGNLEVPAMKIVNATNPDTLTGFFFGVGGRAISLFIKDTLLFAGVSWTTTNFKIYNISNPVSPKLIGQVEISNSVHIDGITVSEDGLTGYAQCLTSSDPSFVEGIYSIDISNINQPVLLDKFEKDTQIGASGISLSQNNLIAAYFSGACIVDISNPNSLILKSFFPTGGYSEKISLQDNYAFIASGLSGLWILDVTNPEKPIAISNIQTGGFTADLVGEQSIVYIVNTPIYENEDTTRGLWVVDISDINNPTIIYHYIGIVNANYSGIFNSVNKSENLVFITQAPTATSNDIVEILDVTSPNPPNSLGVFKENYRAHNTGIKDSTLYLATSNGGLRIIDIHTPYNPEEVGVFYDSTFLVGIFIKDNLAYADRIDTLFILDISVPTQPVILGKVGRNSGSFGGIDLFAVDNFLYWTEWILGVINISNPENPFHLTTFTGKDRGRGISANGDKIYYADQTQGVWILKNNLITDVKNETQIICDYKLNQNYPNPFNPITQIRYSIPKDGFVTLKVFDILGRKIATLVNEEKSAGTYIVNFDANKLSSGIYFYSIYAANFHQTKKMILVK